MVCKINDFRQNLETELTWALIFVFSGVVIISAPEALAALMRSLTEAIFSSGSGVELVWIQAIFTTDIKSFFSTYYRSNIKSNFPL